MANIVPSSPILVILMMEALSSSDTSALTRSARRNNPEVGILQRKDSTRVLAFLLRYLLCWPHQQFNNNA
jgi:hypothetical protein